MTDEPQITAETDDDTTADDAALKELIRISEQVIDPLIGKIKKKYHGQNMRGRMTCPVCNQKKALRVVLIQYRGNGRIRMFCDTENCIRLME